MLFPGNVPRKTWKGAGHWLEISRTFWVPSYCSESLINCFPLPVCMYTCLYFASKCFSCKERRLGTKTMLKLSLFVIAGFYMVNRTFRNVRKKSRNVRNMLRKCPGGVQNISGKVPGNVQEMSRKNPWAFLVTTKGKLLRKIRTFPGHYTRMEIVLV